MGGSPLLPAASAGAIGREAPVRGTQSFVRVMQWCWQHASVVALEVLWRWIFGSVALWVIGSRVLRIFSNATGGTNDLARLGLGQLTFADPMGLAAKLATAGGLLLPAILASVKTLGPPLLLLWLALSTAGRIFVLRRVDPRLSVRPMTLVALQALRVLGLAACFLLWIAVIRWGSATTIRAPLARGDEPHLVAYFAVAILGTLGLFAAWALVSWALSLAPLLSMLRGTGVVESLRGSLAGGPLRIKLIEINLVMGIVKVALVVLLMVFSACPLPFESVTTPQFLFWWTMGVTLLYLLASDFFHVARQVAYLELWRAFQPGQISR